MISDTLYLRIRQILQQFDQLAAGGAPVCLAIAAPDTALAALLRMPGVHARIEHMARGKAYTAAKMHCSTSALHERLIREKLSLADFMDERMTSMPGGVPMFDENGVLIAGIGVSGRSPEEDEPWRCACATRCSPGRHRERAGNEHSPPFLYASVSTCGLPRASFRARVSRRSRPAFPVP